jgi:glycosyltransferase involved in cell wall biosynthesis
MKHKNILIVVEPNFHNTHVGVRRVIRYHFETLVAAGHSVSLATPTATGWRTCSVLDATQAVLGGDHLSERHAPTWQSGDGIFDMILPQSAVCRHEKGVPWTGETVSPAEFDESILSNPWLCVYNGKQVADANFSVGIVYDMVPNLISLGFLRMPQFIDVYKFAHEHHVGYEYFARNARRISCISESTKYDFSCVYGTGSAAKLDVCIPFKTFGNGTMRAREEARDVLLINILDHRKNFSTVLKTLKKASKKSQFSVVIVGRERLPITQVMEFLNEISAVCSTVKWYRSPSDEQVEDMMHTAKVLFFPSIYEGLGLPILEAQAKGIPVISSNTSSCKEINLNPTLTASPYDYEAFADKLISLTNDTVSVLSDTPLRDQQRKFLLEKNQLNFSN